MPAAQPQRLDKGQARWQGIWRTRGPLAHLLWPVSILYGWLTALRRRLFAAGVLKTVRLPVPVIVVGNVVVGGAGKTPTVLALLQHLQQRGWQPGVVSRGHGRRGTGVLEVHPDTPATDSGDEPALIRRSAGVPVFVAARRSEAGQALLAAHPGVDLIVCDDGLQHLALGRDLSIAVFDDRSTGNGWLLPAGLLQAACRSYANLGVLYATLDPGRAVTTCQTGLATASKIGDFITGKESIHSNNLFFHEPKRTQAKISCGNVLTASDAG